MIYNFFGNAFRRQDNRGFTFIEVLYATAILVIALLAIVGANTYIRRANEAMNERILEIKYAEMILEQLRYLANGPGTFPGNVFRLWPQGGRLLIRSRTFERLITVNYVDPAADPLDVTVTVDWRSVGTRPSSVGIRSLVTRRG